MDRKKIIILGSLVALLIALLVFLLFFNRNKDIETQEKNDFKVEFLSAEQKNELGLDQEIKAQAFRDSDGNLIYKIINNDSEIVLDPVAENLMEARN